MNYKSIATMFTINNADFILNGIPFRILAGAMHYFRILPQQWDDRLQKMRAMGLNTLETYVAWNAHEPEPGQFDFSGGLDLANYIKQAAAHGLYSIIRPGPYICAEWEFGGLPAWLLRDPNMRLRCMNRPYLDAVDRYLDALLPQLVPLQITHGGSIIALQIENEYGSYGNDAAYLHYLEDAYQARGIDVLLFTSDGPDADMLQYGTLPHILKTVNFGSNAKNAFPTLRKFQPNAPLMCAEFWNGWFDHWGEEHHTRPPEDAAAALDEILQAGASVNFYMFHGGTNFGFLNGANHHPDKLYQPTITSYDYDAPLSEAGDITHKYLAFRETIGKYAHIPAEQPPNSPKKGYGEVKLTETAVLFNQLDSLSASVHRPTPEPMENLGQAYGFILYRTHIPGPRTAAPLVICDLRDRAQIFLNGKFIGVLEREFPERTLSIAMPPEGATLDILVENMGRVNYGPYLLDRKGITESVRLGQQFLFDWTIYPLPLTDLSTLTFMPIIDKLMAPAFYRGTFAVDEPADTFLALPGWTKGCCWINGFNLGRYWERGPQQTLYVPAPLLRAGKNELILFELHGGKQLFVEFRDMPEVG